MTLGGTTADGRSSFVFQFSPPGKQPFYLGLCRLKRRITRAERVSIGRNGRIVRSSLACRDRRFSLGNLLLDLFPLLLLSIRQAPPF